MKTTTRLSALLIMLCTLFIGQQAMAQGTTSSDAHTLTNEQLKEFVGQFDPPAGQFFSITVSLDGDDKLMAQPTDKSQPNTLMVAKAEDKFELLNTGGITFTFTRENDKIVSLTFAQGGQSFTATKVKKE